MKLDGQECPSYLCSDQASLYRDQARFVVAGQ
jgi:hypothetical protein